MPKWSPKPFWSGKDVIVLGGGPSLEGFDFDLLKNQKVIGCNKACQLGGRIVDILVFGDVKWWDREGQELTKGFSGLIVTNAPALYEDSPERVLCMRRISSGLHRKALGWNGNTGASALNLALILGAKRIFLLGIDMKTRERDSKTHWHEGYGKWTGPEKYLQFLRGWVKVKEDLKNDWPYTKVVNVNDDSALSGFQSISLDTFKAQLKEK